MKLIVVLMLLITGCSSPESSSSRPYTEVPGRESRESCIYRLRTAEGWTVHMPTPDETLLDTKKPICELSLTEGDEQIRITIHNFPADAHEVRIPSQAQVVRWKKQFTALDALSVSVIPQAFNGFSGLLFEGTGQLNNREMTMMAWTMQLANEHFSSLGVLIAEQPEDRKNLFKQRRADYTFKALGSRELIAKHRDAIIGMARCFELIQPIPCL